MDDITIASDQLSARIVSFGASLADLRLSSIDRSLVLGFPDPNHFVEDRQFMGAVIGRYANRIANGHAILNGAPLSLECNEGGHVHLHGGNHGFARQHWFITGQTDSSVKLSLESHDGDAGFPGNLKTTAEYVVESDVLRLVLSAVSDQDTIINLCHHPYFNLDGKDDISGHALWIDAKTYLPSDENLLPLGAQTDVKNTPFDFTFARSLSEHDFNNTYCLHHEQRGPMRRVASLQAGGVKMELSTTQPGLHLYSGYKLKPGFEGHNRQPYMSRSGICLEAQAWPDSPNIEGAPTVTLEAGQLYQQITEYKFSLPQQDDAFSAFRQGPTHRPLRFRTPIKSR